MEHKEYTLKDGQKFTIESLMSRIGCSKACACQRLTNSDDPADVLAPRYARVGHSYVKNVKKKKAKYNDPTSQENRNKHGLNDAQFILALKII